MRVAQDLYTGGYISYPRTSSQILPPELGLPKIIKDLQKQGAYTELCAKLLKRKTLAPNNGKKTDPAHPAIFPTGVAPKNLAGRTASIYDLIVRRFLSTFGDPAVRETQSVTIQKGTGTFVARGTHTVDAGWHAFYGRHVKLDEEILPAIAVGETLKGDVTNEKKMTQPPRRYTPASIIKELEKRGLGTKATRADIVDGLYERGYVDEQSITASELGLVTIDTLERFAPEIIDEQLTKTIEEDIEKIRAGEIKPDEVLELAQSHLTKTLTRFKTHEKEVGTALAAAERIAQEQAQYARPVPVRRDAPDPQGQVRPLHRLQPLSGVQEHVQRAAERITPPDRQAMRTLQVSYRQTRFARVLYQHAVFRQTAAEDPKSKICPKCSKPLALRSSFYGQFWGCSSYPKCRYVELSRAVTEGKEEEGS